MKQYRCAIIVAVLLYVSAMSLAQTQEFTTSVTTDPDQAPFILEDVKTFIRAYSLLGERSDTLEVLQAAYLDRGTPGLKMFIAKYDLTAERLLKAIRKFPDRYEAIERVLPILDEQIRESREAFKRLKEVMPGVAYPPTYFLVESSRGIGSGSIEGQLISIEKWEPPVQNEATLMVHELVHFQQGMAVGYEKYAALFGPERNLLGLCIREGTAEFFAHLVTGKITQDEALAWTLKHEEELWKRFRGEMRSPETGDWMWSPPADPGQPMHVGYALGFRIVQHYYESARDKEEAVRQILSVTDYAGFLDRSGYARQFEE